MITVSYRPPAVNAVAVLAAASSLAERAGAEVLLAASQGLVPVEEGVLLASGRVVDTETGAAVTYGRDDDGTDKHAPSNRYAARVHEDLTAHHPNGGQAKFLETPTHSQSGEILAAMAAVLRTAL